MTDLPLIDLRREKPYLRDLGRAFAGALIFNIPLLMTMEMWEQGVVMDRGRLLAFVLAGLPLALPSYVAALSWIGFFPDLAGRNGSIIVLTSSSVIVSTGATVTESPVCTPIASTFSIVAIVMQLSAESRTSSSSISFQPRMDSSMSTFASGETVRPSPAMRCRSSML